MRLPRKTTSERPKVLLTWKCASRHNGVHFFDISTSKSALNVVCFVHFDLDMCFAPQCHALFQHLNAQQWSEPGGDFCVLYILTWKCASRHNSLHFFDIATSKSAPNLRCFVHFDLKMCFEPQRRAIFHISSAQLAPQPPLYEPTFRPSGATNHLKNAVNRDFPTFAHTCLFFLPSHSPL